MPRPVRAKAIAAASLTSRHTRAISFSRCSTERLQRLRAVWHVLTDGSDAARCCSVLGSTAGKVLLRCAAVPQARRPQRWRTADSASTCRCAARCASTKGSTECARGRQRRKPARRRESAVDNMQQTTCNGHHAADTMQQTPCYRHHATDTMQLTTDNVQPDEADAGVQARLPQSVRRRAGSEDSGTRRHPPCAAWTGPRLVPRGMGPKP